MAKRSLLSRYPSYICIPTWYTKFFNEWVYSLRVLARHVSDLTGPSSGAFYKLYLQIWYVVLLCVLLDTSSRYEVNSKIKLSARKLIHTRLARTRTLLYSLEEELASYCLMMGRKFIGLITRSIKRMAFELAIKKVLPIHFQYSKAEHAGSGGVTLCAAIVDGSCASTKLLQRLE